MRNNTFIKIKSRIYEHANILTWLSVIFIISLALGLRGYNVEEKTSAFLLVLPGIAAFTILAIVFTKSALSLFGNIIACVFIAVVAFSVVTASLAYSPSGLLSGVWFTTILAGVFGTLALSYLLRSFINPYHLAALSSVINVLTVMFSLLTFAYIFPQSTITAEMLGLRLTLLGLVVSLVVSFVSIYISSRAYKTSFSKNKVLAKDWLENNEHTDNTLLSLEGVVSKKGYTFETFKYNGHRNAFAFKDNQSILFVPLEIAFKEKEMTKSLARNAKVGKKTFDKIISSVVNHFSGVYSLPSIPVLIIFVVPEGTINRVVAYKAGNSTYSDSIVFMPEKEVARWLEDIEKKDSMYVAVFPELNEKEKTARDEFAKSLSEQIPVGKAKKKKLKAEKAKRKDKTSLTEENSESSVDSESNENSADIVNSSKE